MTLVKLTLAALLLSFAGCASPTPLVKLRISDGGRITAEFPKGIIVGEDHSEVNVDAAIFLVNTQLKKGNHCISIEFKKKVVPRSVKVEEVTADKAQLLIDDQAPKLTGTSWRSVCATLGPDDPSLQWVHEIDDSFRVYRVTVVLSDGRQIIQHHATVYPEHVKARMRREFGIDLS